MGQYGIEGLNSTNNKDNNKIKKSLSYIGIVFLIIPKNFSCNFLAIVNMAVQTTKLNDSPFDDVGALLIQGAGVLHNVRFIHFTKATNAERIRIKNFYCKRLLMKAHNMNTYISLF